MGHTLGLKHYRKGMITSTSNGYGRNNKVYNKYIKRMIKIFFERINNRVGKGTNMSLEVHLVILKKVKLF